VKLNVGCGFDLRDGWVNLDPWGPPGSVRGDARDLRDYHDRCELVLLNHVLHLFEWDEADRVLEECSRCLTRDGELVVVEADIIGAIDTFITSGETPWLFEVIADEVEPTPEGKLLRWASWHGTRRSLWGWDNLTDRFHALELETLAVPADEDDHWAGTRAGESFVAIGTRR